MSLNFWKNKKVLITGSDGFKGSWLALTLEKLGANVYNIGLTPEWSPTIFSAHSNLVDKSTCLNLSDYKQLETNYNRIEPQVVFHLAAQPIVLRSYKDPIETIQSNIIGTVNLLDVIKNTKERPKVLINVTSDKVYDNKDLVQSFREGDALGGKDIYSASKACSEILTSSYKQSFLSDVCVATARAGNVVGGGDWSEQRIVPDIVRAISTNSQLIIRNPDSVRPWQHVLDPIWGYLTLARKMYSDEGFEGAWNFGPALDKPFTVENVLSEMKIHWEELDKSSKIILNQTKVKQEANYLQVDSTKARSLLNWRSSLDFSKSMEWTTKWYKEYHSFQNKNIVLTQYTLSQIDNYLEKVLSYEH